MAARRYVEQGQPVGPVPGVQAVKKLCLIVLLACLGPALPLKAVDYGEFASDSHRRVIWSLHMSLNNRDMLAEKFKFADGLGFGFSLYFLISPESVFTPHKLLYFYVDNDLSGMFKDQLVYAVSPGFMVRTFIPFFKLSYGAGVQYKIGGQGYPPWGVYGQAMLDFHRFYIGSRFVFHPGINVVENEIQVGYLFSGRYR